MTAAVSGGDLRISARTRCSRAQLVLLFCARCGLREWSIPEMTLVYFYVLVCRVLMDRLDRWQASDRTPQRKPLCRDRQADLVGPAVLPRRPPPLRHVAGHDA